MSFLNRIFYFASSGNGYDRGCIDTAEDKETVLKRIHQGLDIIGFDKNRTLVVSEDEKQMGEMEEKYLEEQK